MAFHLRHNLILFSAFLLLAALNFTAAEDDAAPPSSADEDDVSSSEETVEDSNESRRRKRSVELPSAENGSKAAGGDGAKNAARAIPGFPDPATIIKIAEILQTVGQKVVPILVEGNPIADLVAERVGRDFMFLKNFKDELDTFTTDFKI